MLRFLTAGESHGPGLVAIVEGLPKGLTVTSSDFADELERRRRGYGRGNRMSIENDDLEILGGVRHGRTLGSPVAVLVRNTEWPKWSEIMSPAPGTAGKEVTRPRPGHADLAGMIKYATDDARDVLERASARETAARTIAGVLARKLLDVGDIVIMSHVVGIGDVVYDGPTPAPGEIEAIEHSPVRCVDPDVGRRMIEAIDRAQSEKDTLGGVFEILAHGVPIGVGSHVQHDRRLDALLAGSVMSIPAIKGVEIGDGFETARSPGSMAHDEIVGIEDGLGRETNRAGGVEGGMSNGEVVRVRAAMKPLSTLMQPLKTIDMSTGEPAQAVRERSDVCAVPAAAVVGEQMVAITIAGEMLRKFGGDTVAEFDSAVQRYRESVAERLGR
jgi:chorismate synthase